MFIICFNDEIKLFTPGRLKRASFSLICNNASLDPSYFIAHWKHHGTTGNNKPEMRTKLGSLTIALNEIFEQIITEITKENQLKFL